MKKTLVIVHTIDARTGEDREICINSRRTLEDLIRDGRLYPTDKVAKMTGKTVGYIRRLCTMGMVDVERILGRYYFTPKQVNRLHQPIRGIFAAINGKK
jgi:hypothetical protein